MLSAHGNEILLKVNPKTSRNVSPIDMNEGSYLSLQGGPRAANTTGIAIPPSTVSVLLESLCTVYITMRIIKLAPLKRC